MNTAPASGGHRMNGNENPVDDEKTAPKFSRHPVRTLCLSFFFLALIVTTVWITVSRHRLYRELNLIKNEYRELKARDDAVSRVKSRRAGYFRIQAFLNFPRRAAFGSSRFIRRLGSLDSNRLAFSELNLIPGNQSLAFDLKASIQSRDPGEQALIVESFCRQLKSWHDVFDVKCRTGNPDDSPSGSAVLTVSGSIELE